MTHPCFTGRGLPGDACVGAVTRASRTTRSQVTTSALSKSLMLAWKAVSPRDARLACACVCVHVCVHACEWADMVLMSGVSVMGLAFG